MTSNKKKISVLMPCFNAEDSLHETLNSLLKQSINQFELIIIDDCSNDGSIHLCRQLLHSIDFQLIELKENVGPGEARNVGIKYAKSNLIAFLDADDIWDPRKLQLQLALHEKTKCAISCTGYRFGKSEVFSGDVDYVSLLKNNVINTSSVMYDKTKLDLKFDQDYGNEDYIAWLQVAKKNKIHFINEVLVIRKNFDGLSSDKIKMAINRWHVYRKIENFGFFQTVYYFTYYALTAIKKYSKLYT